MTKLLLVEDHEELWDFLSRRLRKRGFEVILAHDGRQALDAVTAQAPDLVLLDMDLPVMDGWTVARTLREASDRTPLIALTAHAMSGDREKALAAGCDLALHCSGVLADSAGLLAACPPATDDALGRMRAALFLAQRSRQALDPAALLAERDGLLA